jgi:hypothetical protein
MHPLEPHIGKQFTFIKNGTGDLSVGIITAFSVGDQLILESVSNNIGISNSISLRRISDNLTQTCFPSQVTLNTTIQKMESKEFTYDGVPLKNYIDKEFTFLTNDPIGTCFKPGDTVILVAVSDRYATIQEKAGKTTQACDPIQISLKLEEVLVTLPERGWCMNPSDRLVKYLNEKFNTNTIPSANGIAWSSRDCWGIVSYSGNKKFTMKELNPFLDTVYPETKIKEELVDIDAFDKSASLSIINPNKTSPDGITWVGEGIQPGSYKQAVWAAGLASIDKNPYLDGRLDAFANTSEESIHKFSSIPTPHFIESDSINCSKNVEKKIAGLKSRVVVPEKMEPLKFNKREGLVVPLITVKKRANK